MLVFQPVCCLVPRYLNWKPESLLLRTQASQKTQNWRWLNIHVLTPKSVGRSQSLQILQPHSKKEQQH